MEISGLLAVDELFSNVGLHFPIWVLSCSSWWVPLFLEVFVSGWVPSPQEFNTNFTVKWFLIETLTGPKRLRKMIVLNRQGDQWFVEPFFGSGNQSCLSRTTFFKTQCLKWIQEGSSSFIQYQFAAWFPCDWTSCLIHDLYDSPSKRLMGGDRRLFFLKVHQRNGFKPECKLMCINVTWLSENYISDV